MSIAGYAVVKEGGKQIIGEGAVAEGARIYDSEQIIF